MHTKNSPPRPSVTTIEQVAKLAGVSMATVSRVLNGSERVSERTAEKVRAVVTASGYIPNLLAGSLASSRSRLVAVVVPEIGLSLFGPTIQSMADTLWENGFHVLLAQTGSHDERQDEIVASVLGRRPDGVILTGVTTGSILRGRLKHSTTPIIETWDLPAEPLDMAIGFSHEAVGQGLARYVEERGYRAPLLLCADSTRAVTRMTGFLRDRQERGLPVAPHYLTQSPSTIQHGRDGLIRMLEEGHRPDVIVCSSDLMALGVLMEAQRRGMAVPDDLAVIGFGAQAFSEEVRPSLTTVHIDGAAIGRKSVEFLIRRTQGLRPEPAVVDIGFSIIARQSA